MSKQAINSIINSMKESIEEVRKKSIKLIGETVSEDIKSIYRSKSNYIPYEKMIGDEKLILNRPTSEMAQAVIVEESDQSVKIFFSQKDNELLTEAKQHEIFGEIKPWQEFRNTLIPPSKDGKEYIKEVLSDIGIKVGLNK